MTIQDKTSKAEINHNTQILWQRKRKRTSENLDVDLSEMQFPLQILAHAEEIANSPLVQSKIIYAVVFIPIETHWSGKK